VQNDSVCLFSDSLPIFWEYLPDKNILGGDDTTLCIGDSLILNAASGYGATYAWQGGSTLPAYLVKQAGIYKVEITNDCGSVDISKNVQYIFCADSVFVPNAFTPNNDGVNDIFRPKYYYTFKQYSMQIYNRYGEKIFSSIDISNGWNGYFGGKLQKAGTYVYLINYKNNKGEMRYLKGTVVLIR
jgi:gliding motility-associated-like protein